MIDTLPLMRLSLLFALLLAACQPADPADDTPVVNPASAPAAESDASADVDLVKATAQEVLDHVAASPARVKVVNFWATWCIPCREEFPDLVRLEHDLGPDVDVIFVSADFLDEEPGARAFLAEQGVDGVSFLKNEGDDAFISAFDDGWMGELPTTIVYGPDDRKVVVLTEKVTYESLRARIAPLLTS